MVKLEIGVGLVIRLKNSVIVPREKIVNMTSESIGKVNIRSDFKSLTTLGFDKIIENWNGDYPMTTRDWWKLFTPFGKFFLESMCYNIIDITEENYDEFLPIMEDYFLTDKEYEIIVRNVAFLKKDSMTAYKETPMYKIYNMMNFWNVKPTFTELGQMTYKRFMKLYLYTLGERFIVPMREKEQQDKKGNIYQ